MKQFAFSVCILLISIVSIAQENTSCSDFISNERKRLKIDGNNQNIKTFVPKLYSKKSDQTNYSSSESSPDNEICDTTMYRKYITEKWSDYDSGLGFSVPGQSSFVLLTKHDKPVAAEIVNVSTNEHYIVQLTENCAITKIVGRTHEGAEAERDMCSHDDIEQFAITKRYCDSPEIVRELAIHYSATRTGDAALKYYLSRREINSSYCALAGGAFKIDIYKNRICECKDANNTKVSRAGEFCKNIRTYDGIEKTRNDFEKRSQSIVPDTFDQFVFNDTLCGRYRDKWSKGQKPSQSYFFPAQEQSAHSAD